MSLQLPKSFTILARPLEHVIETDHFNANPQEIRTARYELTHESGLVVLLAIDQRPSFHPDYTMATPCCRAEVWFRGMERKAICSKCSMAVPLAQGQSSIPALGPSSSQTSAMLAMGQATVELWLGLHIGPLAAVLESEKLYEDLLTISFQREALAALTAEAR